MPNLTRNPSGPERARGSQVNLRTSWDPHRSAPPRILEGRSQGLVSGLICQRSHHRQADPVPRDQDQEPRLPISPHMRGASALSTIVVGGLVIVRV